MGICYRRMAAFQGGRVATIVFNNNRTPRLWRNESNTMPPNVSANQSAHFVVLVRNCPECSIPRVERFVLLP